MTSRESCWRRSVPLSGPSATPELALAYQPGNLAAALEAFRQVVWSVAPASLT